MQVTANGISIEVEDGGPEGAPAILLVNGYTSQLLNWPDPLLDGLKAEGFRVIRYDNRDVGLSQKFTGVPDFKAVVEAVAGGKTPNIPYTLKDMATDGMGVLDALGIDRAHVVGVSMGGMIVQRMAIHFPERLHSMTSIMSTTGNPDLPPARPDVIAALNAPPPSEDRDTVIAHRMKGRRAFESPAFPKPDDELRALIAADFDRMYYPEGAARQYGAILGDGNRVPLLQKVAVPSLVIHGIADPLVPVEGGKDTAAAIPGAELKLFEGMGHDLPEPLCGDFVALISAHAKGAAKAEA